MSPTTATGVPADCLLEKAGIVLVDRHQIVAVLYLYGVACVVVPSGADDSAVQHRVNNFILCSGYVDVGMACGYVVVLCDDSLHGREEVDAFELLYVAAAGRNVEGLLADDLIAQDGVFLCVELTVETRGGVFLQNAETVHIYGLTSGDDALYVVDLECPERNFVLEGVDAALVVFLHSPGLLRGISRYEIAHRSVSRDAVSGCNQQQCGCHTHRDEDTPRRGAREDLV